MISSFLFKKNLYTYHEFTTNTFFFYGWLFEKVESHVFFAMDLWLVSAIEGEQL